MCLNKGPCLHHFTNGDDSKIVKSEICLVLFSFGEVSTSSTTLYIINQLQPNLIQCLSYICLLFEQVWLEQCDQQTSCLQLKSYMAMFL